MVRLMTFLCDFCIGALGFKLRGKGSWFLSKVAIDLSPSKRRHRVLTKIWSIYKNRITCFTLDIFYAKGRICISCSNKKAERTYKWMHVCIMNIYIYIHLLYIYKYNVYKIYHVYLVYLIEILPFHTYFHLLIPKLRAGRCAVRTGGRKRCWWPKRWGLMSLMYPLHRCIDICL